MNLWLIVLHVFSVFLFLLGHGASVNVAFVLKRERSPERIRALLDLSVWSYNLTYGGLLGLLATGIVSGFLGDYWGRGWIWAAIVLLVVIAAAMSIVGSLYYGRVRTAVGLKPYRRTGQDPLGEVQSEVQLAALLNSDRPLWLAAIGLGGLFVMLWLMFFKPF